MAARGGQGGGAPNNNSRPPYNGRGRGNRGRSGHGPKGGRGGGHGSNFEAGVFYQVCGNEGHPAYRCFKRYDLNFTALPPQKMAAAATSSSYGVDSNWYMDTGATDHITGELEKLTIRDKYTSIEQVHAANGAGMNIGHVGHSILQSSHSQIHLKNILHVPKSHKSLVSVHRLNFYVTWEHEVYF
jgi:histone deacetylase 1/2